MFFGGINEQTVCEADKRALKGNMDNDKSNYILRRAAGLYWLLDAGQEGVPYKKPLPMNEVGARIFSLKKEGADREEIADTVSSEYDVGRETALLDTAEFEKQLERYGIRF